MVWPTANIPTYGRGVWLECNGQSFSTTQFPQLYEALGTNRVPNYQGVFLRGYGTANSLGRKNGAGKQIQDNFSSGKIGEIQGDATRYEVFHLYNHYGQSGDYWTFHSGGISFMGAGEWEWHQRNIGDGNYSMNAVGVNYDFGEQEWHIPKEGPLIKDVQCSGGGEDSSVSCDVTYAEETIEKVASYSNKYHNDWWFDVDDEIRPVNVAVKFMIKAK